MKKTLKYMLYLLLLLLLILMLVLAFVLHTESGSRFAIKQVIGLADLDLTYDSINGNVSDGLVINNIRYVDQSIDIQIKNINYKSDWSWFSRYLELSNVKIDDVIVTTHGPSIPKAENEPFTGIKLPLIIDVKKMLINQLTLVSDGESNTIDVVELSALFEPIAATINKLKLQATNHALSTAGSLHYENGISYQLDTDWQAASAGQAVQANGVIEGDLNVIKLHQALNVESEQLHGQFMLQGDAIELQGLAEFEVQLSASEAKMLLDQHTVELKDFHLELNGLIDDYQLSLQSELAQQQLVEVNLPLSQIKFQASGNREHLTTQTAQITTAEGLIELQAEVDWQDQLQIDSHLELSNFNPQQLLQNWPGMINGQIDLDWIMSEQGMVITADNNSLKGQLKGQPFTLSGSAKYASDTVSTEQLRLELGDNQILINGQVNAQDVTLTAAVNWQDLSLLDADLAGHVEGTLEMSGAYPNPQVKAELKGQQLTVADHQISALSLISTGHWNHNLDTAIAAKDAVIAGQTFSHIQLQQNGWLDSHDVEVKLNNNELSSLLKLKGQYDNNATQKQPVWQGQIISHELTVNSDKKIQLQAPMAIEVADHISVEAGCWRGVEAGTLCIALNDIKKSDSSFQGSLKLDAFSLIPLQVLMPENIEVKGKLQGVAEFLYHGDDLTVDSNIMLQNGELLLRNEQQIAYQSAFDVFEINAKTTNQTIDVEMSAQLSDESFLNLAARLENFDRQQWQINSTIDGLFLNTELISELTEEIKELTGQITIDGSITGPLFEPVIDVNLNQSEGYLALARLGTAIEQLYVSISTVDIQKPIYKIELSGQNSASLNQGKIESFGELSFSGNQQWQYLGQITGDNFMVLNLPEIEFNISPNLTIVANQKTTNINGELNIDSGHVIVKQLPHSSVSNSDDLEIHTSVSENTVDYPVTMNVHANIIDPIKLDVIGLQAGLTGSIQLVNAKGKTLEGKGILNLTDGSYEIYGQKLNINQGELTFTGPLDNPRLNVKASRKSISGDVVAGVELGGTVNNLQSNLFSEPSLADLEKLSYIMTGRGIENSGSLNGESLKQAAIVMGLNQSSPIFNQIQNQFGIDVLTVRESAVAADTVVEAGKKINDKLYISYNQGLFNRLGFWMLKYRLNEFLNLESTQGEDQSIELVYTRKAEVKENNKADENN